MIDYYIEKDGFKVGEGRCQKEAIDSVDTLGGTVVIGAAPPELQWPVPVKSYSTKRREAYPPLNDLADALYWQSQGDDSKMQEYLAAVDQVKQKYPKPI